MRALLVSLLVGAGCGPDAPPVPREAPPFPAPAPASPAASVARADFVGAEACRGCHTEAYRAWAASTHGRAGGVPGPDVVIAPFDGSPIRFADGTVTPRVRGGTWEFVVRQDGFAEQVFPVVGVIGRGHMRGGGTQGFLTAVPDGTQRFLPWDWSRTAGTWFCNTGTRLDEGWEPIRADMALAACGDWPPLRPIGTLDRFANCQECHGSQIGLEFDAAAGTYETEYTTLQVNCESCHGPGRRHVEMAGAGTFTDVDIGLESLAWTDKDASLSVCFQCHALKDVIAEGYLPGEDLTDHYALAFPALGEEPWHIDGRVRTFAYQANHLASACYLEGPMDCVSCHEPHGQGYWDVDRQPLASPFDDGQCTACHASKAADPAQHTFHALESEGSRCVSCHMPYLQHPEVGEGVPFARSDHTIAVPRPAFDASLGIVSACAQCHQDTDAATLERWTEERWGAGKPQRPLIQAQRDALAGRGDPAALLRPDLTDPLVQFQALARVLTDHLQPDMGTLPPGVAERLEALAGSPDLEVRSLALAALHWSRGDDPRVRTLLVDALGRAEDAAALRGRWVLALGFLGDRARATSALQQSERAYAKALEIAPGDPRILSALGQLRSQAGDLAGAIDAFRGSLAADAAQPLVQVNLGVALEAAGDPAGARRALEDAARLDPHEALAWFNLGNLHQRAGRLPDAAEAYARAVAADPGLGRGQFELARTLLRLQRFQEALPHARRAVEFMPDHAPSRQMLADLERALGG
ncbi:MAG: tetratricopeptide repeat protein [Gemmatimonadota bacterium]